MSKSRILYWVAAAGATALTIELVTGLILWFAVPGAEGPRFGRGAGGRSFAGLERGTYIDVHDWSGLALVAIVLVHILFHWRWILRQTRALVSARR